MIGGAAFCPPCGRVRIVGLPSLSGSASTRGYSAPDHPLG